MITAKLVPSGENLRFATRGVWPHEALNASIFVGVGHTFGMSLPFKLLGEVGSKSVTV